jgi:hypothetical protein
VAVDRRPDAAAPNGSADADFDAARVKLSPSLAASRSIWAACASPAFGGYAATGGGTLGGGGAAANLRAWAPEDEVVDAKRHDEVPLIVTATGSVLVGFATRFRMRRHVVRMGVSRAGTTKTLPNPTLTHGNHDNSEPVETLA